VDTPRDEKGTLESFCMHVLPEVNIKGWLALEGDSKPKQLTKLPQTKRGPVEGWLVPVTRLSQTASDGRRPLQHSLERKNTCGDASHSFAIA
jgi:hypothetical protein